MSTGAAAAAGAGGAVERLSRLGGVAVTVPDPRATARFLEMGIGFAIAEAPGGGGELHAVLEGDYGDRGQLVIRLREGAELRLDAVVWEVSDDYSFDALGARLATAGVAASETPTGGLTFRDPGGNPIACEQGSSPGRLVAKPAPGAIVGPRRIGHLNLKTARPAETARFYADVLGLKVSEQIGDALFFMRIAAEHHNLGLRPGEAGDLHHLGLELPGFVSYQPILDRLAAHDWKLEYGPGRHGPGRNLFAYVRDPSSGLRCELFADMAQIPDETTYVARRWEAGDRMTRTINRWGPTPPESFLA